MPCIMVLKIAFFITYYVFFTLWKTEAYTKNNFWDIKEINEKYRAYEFFPRFLHAGDAL